MANSDIPFEERLPVSSYELIDQLDAAYPHQCVRPGQTFEQAHREAGKRELIDALLEARAEELETEALDSTQE